MRQLQKHNGLPKTGEVDEELWALIFSEDILFADEPEKNVESSEEPAAVLPVREDAETPYEVPGAPERDEHGFVISGDEYTFIIACSILHPVSSITYFTNSLNA